ERLNARLSTDPYCEMPSITVIFLAKILCASDSRRLPGQRTFRPSAPPSIKIRELSICHGPTGQEHEHRYARIRARRRAESDVRGRHRRVQQRRSRQLHVLVQSGMIEMVIGDKIIETVG